MSEVRPTREKLSLVVVFDTVVVVFLVIVVFFFDVIVNVAYFVSSIKLKTFGKKKPCF